MSKSEPQKKNEDVAKQFNNFDEVIAYLNKTVFDGALTPEDMTPEMKAEEEELNKVVESIFNGLNEKERKILLEEITRVMENGQGFFAAMRDPEAAKNSKTSPAFDGPEGEGIRECLIHVSETMSDADTAHIHPAAIRSTLAYINKLENEVDELKANSMTQEEVNDIGDRLERIGVTAESLIRQVNDYYKTLGQVVTLTELGDLDLIREVAQRTLDKKYSNDKDEG